MAARIWIALGSISAALSLIVAAQFGHAVEGLSALAVRAVFDTANHIHLAHSLALVAVGILSGTYGSRITFNIAGGAFVIGIALFCGGIYVQFGEPGQRPYIPIGGASLMIGWVALAASMIFLGKKET